MTKRVVCIYCGRSDVKFCKSHVLPRGLGKFQNQPTLLHRVCGECDSAIGKFEDQFIHCGIAAFFRNKIGIKGRSSFRRGHVGRPPIETIARDPITKYEILVEPTDDGQNFQSLPQLIVDDTKGNCARITLFNKKDITAELLSDEIKKTRLKGKLKVTPFGLTQTQEDHIFSLLKISIVETSGGDGFSIIPVQTKSKLTCDERYFQALAKIAFHYYLISEQSYHNGSESIFDPLRQFIRYGKGDIDSFVNQKRGHLTVDTAKGLRPKFYGHLFVGHLNRTAVIVNLQFFIGPGCYPPYYQVLLARNPFTVAIPLVSFGHHYVYFNPDELQKHQGYNGIVQKLGAANHIIIPS